LLFDGRFCEFCRLKKSVFAAEIFSVEKATQVCTFFVLGLGKIKKNRKNIPGRILPMIPEF